MTCSTSSRWPGPPKSAPSACGSSSALPEVTGVRLYAVPPAGKPLFERYVDMIRGFGRVAKIVARMPDTAVPVSA